MARQEKAMQVQPIIAVKEVSQVDSWRIKSSPIPGKEWMADPEYQKENSEASILVSKWTDDIFQLSRSHK